MKYIIFGLFAIIMGYSSEWSPYVVQLFNASGELNIVGKLSAFHQSCTAPSSSDSVCTDEFFLPASIFKSNGSQQPEIGFGTVMVASEIYCKSLNRLNLQKVYDDPSQPGKLYDSRNIYQTLTIPTSGCEEGLLIRAWALKNSTRSGYVGGLVTVGSSILVQQVKKIHEFYNSGIRITILFVIIFTFLVSSILKSRAKESQTEDPFIRYQWAWLSFLVISSGFLQLIIPIMHQNLFTRISAMFSLICHFMPIPWLLVNALENRSVTNPWKRRMSQSEIYFFALFGSIAFSPYLLSMFGYFSLVLSIISLCLGTYFKDRLVCAYALVLVLNCLKISNVPFMPNTHVASLFVACILVNRTFFRLRVLERLNESLSWAQGLNRNSIVSRDIDSVVEGIADQTRASRVTFVELLEKGECHIFIGKRIGEKFLLESFTRQEVPTFIAHSITVNEMLLHTSEDSNLYRSLKKPTNGNSEFKSKYFTIVPISDSEEVVAVVGITDYPQEIVKDQDRSLEFKSILELLKPYLAQVAVSRKRERKLKTKETESLILDMLTSMRGEINFEKNSIGLYQILLHKITSLTGFSGFFGMISEQNVVEIEAVSGYSEEVEKQITEGRIVVNKHNQQGPLPLAVNNNRIIIVPDFKRVSHLMNPISSELLKRNEAVSGAAIPVNETSEDAKVLRDGNLNQRGVIWLESKVQDQITFNTIGILEAVKQTFENLVYLKSNQDRSTKSKGAMDKFMPSWVAEKVINGENAQEIEDGYLVMIDAKNSTKIAKEFGQKRWESFVQDSLKPIIDRESKIYGLELHVIIWDAFYLTLGSRIINLDDEKRILNFCDRVTKSFNECYFSQFNAFYPSAGDSLRICVVHGETTRGFSSPPNQVWTIVGSSMAHVSKLEHCVKELPGTVFVTEKCFLSVNEYFAYSGCDLTYTGEKIFSLKLAKESFLAKVS